MPAAIKSISVSAYGATVVFYTVPGGRVAKVIVPYLQLSGNSTSGATFTIGPTFNASAAGMNGAVWGINPVVNSTTASLTEHIVRPPLELYLGAGAQITFTSYGGGSVAGVIGIIEELAS